MISFQSGMNSYMNVAIIFGIKSPKYFQKFKLYVCYLTLKNFLYNVYQNTSRVVFVKSMLELGMISFQIRMNSFQFGIDSFHYKT